MKPLHFDTQKYGKELLIDTVTETEMDIPGQMLSLSFFGIWFFKKGTGKWQMDLHHFDLQNYAVMFLRPAQINIVKEVHYDECFLIVFESAFLDAFLVDKNLIYKFNCFRYKETPPVLYLDQKKFNKYYKLGYEIKKEITESTPAGMHVIRALLYYLLARLDQHYAEQYNFNMTLHADPYFLAFQRLLFSEIEETYSVEAFAKRLKISRVQLNKLCQKYLSKTATQVIKEHRLTEIKKAILFTQNDLSEIAYQYNFSAPSNFSRFVKQMTGQSPQELRDSLL